MAEHRIELLEHGIFASGVIRNPSPAALYEDALHFDEGVLASSGAIIAKSGAKTGRSPKDKRVVETAESKQDIWWGPVNIRLSAKSFRSAASGRWTIWRAARSLYVIDGFAGWDPAYRLKIRVVCSRPYHALFMHNMLMRPNARELADFGEPDYTIYNAGSFPADRRGRRA